MTMNLEEKFNRVKKSKNPEEIDDFLIEIGRNPQIDYLPFIEYFMENCDPPLFHKIKLNLIYTLGEVGKLKKIPVKFSKFLISEYNGSDRWVRDEVIKSFEKLSSNTILDDSVIKLLGIASNEEYQPISINSLKILSKRIDILPKTILSNILNVFNSSSSDLRELASEVLTKIVKNEEELFESLLQNDNYKILKKNAIRSLLVIYFNSIFSLESFRQKIIESKIESLHKDIILNEIKIYKSILSNVL
jgi:hypothetical protein